MRRIRSRARVCRGSGRLVIARGVLVLNLNKYSDLESETESKLQRGIR